MGSDVLLRDAFERYRTTISILKKGFAQESYRIAQISRSFLGDMVVRNITSVDIAKYRDDRLGQVNPKNGKPLSTATVRLDLSLLSNFFEICRIEWGYADHNPVTDVRKPKVSPGRERRLTAREERQIMRYCHSHGNLQLQTIITLALETAMRQSEIIGLTWEHINLRDRTLFLPKTKNGTSRSVPLTVKARDALINWGVKSSGRVFTYSSCGIKSSFKYMTQSLGIEDLHFHDLRHECASRLSELGSLGIMEIAAITGHKSMQMLKRYTHLDASKLVHKLDAPRNKSVRTVLDKLVPYPATVKKTPKGTYRVQILDFPNLVIEEYGRGIAMRLAQGALLNRLLLCMRHGKKIPPPDQYMERVREEEVVMIMPMFDDERVC